ncbi:hypothetical protein [Acidithiobacillus ferriphilus]|jgi:hypothetical protein|uniref:hypothetical protein n=1 Tax=Acidithiobacillus ferriphilus TaxID=1689834 RepID=UPI001E534FEA|nr:hypothetical protein [Acidithiobacillus ferriphilus]UEP57993.1 hypothetical protein K1Y48_06390 [Acidithiobacillus ferriphilus]
MKFDIKEVIFDHINTLRDYRNDRISALDITVTFIIPIIASVLAVPIFGMTYHKQEGNIIISLSVFAALLFNLMILILDKNKNASELEKTQLNEIYYNISYCILVALFDIATLLLISIINASSIEIVLCAIRLLSFFLLLNFFLTMLLILKRMHKVIKNKLK